MERPPQLDLDTVAWVVDISQSKFDGNAHLLQIVCDGLLQRGVAIHRVHVSFIPQHPQLRVGILQWSPGQAVSWGHTSWPDANRRSAVHRRNPLYLLREGHRVEVRSRLTDRKQAQRFRFTDELARSGFTDYFALAIDSGLKVPNTISFATHESNGFSDDDLIVLRSAAWALQPVFQRETWKTLSSTLSTTYIGTFAGRAVLEGTIRRGQMSHRNAVVWFADLRGFSELSETLDDEALFRALHTFFDAVGSAVDRHAGEVLKFIGDAVLAVFHFEDETDAPEACQSAVDSALNCLEALDEVNRSRLASGEPNLRCGIGLHMGRIIYGNVGTETRLDFTAIGQVVNLANRIESLCARLNEHLLVSKEVADLVKEPLNSRGTYQVKGHRQPIEVYGLNEERVFEASQAPGSIPAPLFDD